MTGAKPGAFSVTLDRIEGEVAVLLCSENEGPIYEWHLPRAWLPPGAQEGERLTCALARDPHATAQAKARNVSLLDELSKPEAA